MITKNIVASAYKRGIITLDIDPNMEAGTIARLGEYWFYFGGITAEEMNPDEYKTNVPETDIINEIFDVIDEFKTENPDEYAYYEAVLKESATVWSEIRCDFLDEEDRFWRVDAWRSPDDDAEGEVIAYIDDITGRVLYTEPLARVDTYAQEIIKEKIADLKTPVMIAKKPCDIEISLHTKYGRLIADIEPDNMSGSGYDAVFIGLEASSEPYVYFDLAAVRAHNDKPELDILTWEDIYDEDYTTKHEVLQIEINDLIDHCRE